MTAPLCERCQKKQVRTVELWGQPYSSRYCDRCAELILAEDEQREQQGLVDYLKGRAGMTDRLRGFTWEQASRPDAGRQWLADFDRGVAGNLLLYGGCGAGKTGLAWLIVAGVCERRQEAWLVNFRNLLADMKQAMRNGAASSLAERAAAARVLALDDLGAERPTAWALDELSTIVDRRYEAGLATVVTSNYDPDGLARRLGHEELLLGQRIVSRIVEGALQVRFDEPDRRVA